MPALKTYEYPPLKIDGLVHLMHTCPLKKGVPRNAGETQPTNQPSSTHRTQLHQLMEMP